MKMNPQLDELDDIEDNIILKIDSYKSSHFLQYPPNTTYIHSYIESRGANLPNGGYVRFFGLQYYLLKYLSRQITHKMVLEAQEIMLSHGEPFPIDEWQYIVDYHNGYLPIKIRAVQEGSIIPTHEVLLTIENTDPKTFWLVGWLETSLLRAVWYPTTVATLSYRIKALVKNFLDETADEPTKHLNWMLHDFGARGVSSSESAGIGGLAHLTNFYGTDNVEAIIFGKKYYNADMAGFSIPAAEHSTITSWGRENEALAYENMIDKFAGNGKTYAVVSDSYDIYYAIDKIWGEKLKKKIIEMGGTLVIRPDSGEPSTVVLVVLHKLNDIFGSKLNNKGFLVLNHVKIIQGDGINEAKIYDILKLMKQAGFSSENIVFGMGGALLQAINRDTLNFAMKCSAIKINNTLRDVYKDPVTDKNKISKRGILELVYRINNDNKYENIYNYDIQSTYNDDKTTIIAKKEIITIKREEMLPNDTRLLYDVFTDGKILNFQSLANIREIT